MAPTICCIDGNIGAGKSTVLDELERRGFCVFREDINSWKWCLANFYKKPKRWAFTLQLAILNSSLDQYKKMMKLESPIVFIERSPLSMWAFARVGYGREYYTLDELGLCHELIEKTGWLPDRVLILDTPVDECFKRMRERNRECEKNVDISYLTDLDTEYQEMKKFAYARTVNFAGTKENVADEILTMVQ